MSSAVKGMLAACLVLVSVSASARDISVLVLGDQSAANCHAHPYAALPDVFVLGADGRERMAADPLEWSDCKGGSIWMPLAARLKRQSGVDKVLLVPIAINGARSSDWQAGMAVQRLNTALAAIRKRGVRFDYAIWQQAGADAATPGTLYFDQMRRTIKMVTLTVPVDKWVIGQGGGCGGSKLAHIARAQDQIAHQVILHRFPGASMADLGPDAQAPDCSLTPAGQEIMAQRWFEAMQRTDLLSQRYRKESLVYLFK